MKKRKPVFRLVPFLCLALFLSVSAVQWEPGFFLNDDLDAAFDPLSEAGMIFPAQLDDIASNYRNGLYRLAILKLSKLDSMNVPDGNRDVILLMLAESYRKLDLLQFAARYYEEIVRTYTASPSRVFAVFRLQSYAYDEKQYARLDSLSRLFKEQYSTHPLLGGSQYFLAKGLVRQEKYEDAIAAVQGISRDSDYYLAGHFLNGLCQLALENPTKAFVFLDYLAGMVENSAVADEARLVEGDLYFRSGKYESALRMYDKISLTRSRKEPILLRKADCSFRLKDFGTSIRLARQLLKQSPESEFTLETCLILERCYHATGDTVGANRIKSFVDAYTLRLRTLFLVAGELKHLAQTEMEWGQMETHAAFLVGDKGKNAVEVQRTELKKIQGLRKRLLQLRDQLDPQSRLQERIGPVRFAEQRYLEQLAGYIDRLARDSMDQQKELQTLRIDLETASIPADSLVLANRLIRSADSYRGTCEWLGRLRRTRYSAAREFSSQQTPDNRYSENLQAKFVDWGLFRLEDIKLEIQRENQGILETSKKIKVWKGAPPSAEKSAGEIPSKAEDETP